MKKTILLTTGLLLLFAATTYTFGQSSSRDNPISIGSSEISGSFIDHQEDNDKENFYSFTAGPGELTITFDVKRRRQGDMASIAFELLERNGSRAILCCEVAQSSEDGTGRQTVSVKIARRQTVILHLTNASVGGGTFNVRLSGAAVSIGSSVTGGGPGKVDGGGRERAEGGEQVNVPTRGTLHIRMKNGTAKDIDLSLIRSVTVRQ